MMIRMDYLLIKCHSNISARKLQLMEDLLRIISESSIDCVLNKAETTTGKDKLKLCQPRATNVRSYATVPNIDKEVVDSEKQELLRKQHGIHIH